MIPLQPQMRLLQFCKRLFQRISSARLVDCQLNDRDSLPPPNLISCQCSPNLPRQDSLRQHTSSLGVGASSFFSFSPPPPAQFWGPLRGARVCAGGMEAGETSADSCGNLWMEYQLSAAEAARSASSRCRWRWSESFALRCLKHVYVLYICRDETCLFQDEALRATSAWLHAFARGVSNRADLWQTRIS